MRCRTKDCPPGEPSENPYSLGEVSTLIQANSRQGRQRFKEKTLRRTYSSTDVGETTERPIQNFWPSKLTGVPGQKLSDAETARVESALLRLVASQNLPFTSVESQELKALILQLRPTAVQCSALKTQCSAFKANLIQRVEQGTGYPVQPVRIKADDNLIYGFLVKRPARKAFR